MVKAPELKECIKNQTKRDCSSKLGVEKSLITKKNHGPPPRHQMVRPLILVIIFIIRSDTNIDPRHCMAS